MAKRVQFYALNPWVACVVSYSAPYSHEAFADCPVRCWKNAF
jgi:hypothetical protein